VTDFRRHMTNRLYRTNVGVERSGLPKRRTVYVVAPDRPRFVRRRGESGWRPHVTNEVTEFRQRPHATSGFLVWPVADWQLGILASARDREAGRRARCCSHI